MLWAVDDARNECGGGIELLKLQNNVLYTLVYNNKTATTSSCPFVCAADICYSQQVHIFNLFVFFLLVAIVPYPISEFSCFFFCFFFYFFFRTVALISRVFFFCCAHESGTLALDLPTLIL